MFINAAKNVARVSAKSFPKSFVSKAAVGRVMPIVARSMSTALQEKGMSEETKYIRQQEAAAMKKKLDEILATEGNEEERTEMKKILGVESSEEKGMISKLGLDDWKFAIPAAMLVGIPAISNEVIVLSEELQLTAVFILFCSTMYTQAGGMLSKSLSDYSKEIEDKFKAVDESMMVSLKGAQSANKQLLDLEGDVKSVFELKDSLAKVKAETLNKEEQFKFREEVVRKLDSLAALEDSAVHALKTRMLTKVKADVVETFKKDQKAKDAALAAAMAVLQGGANAKMGKDVVGEEFSKAIAKYTAEYKKQPEGSDEIIKKLESDIAALVKPPNMTNSGGNVYETHQII